MARVRPFRGWRYSSESVDITPLVAPPYDVISPEQRADLIARDAHNVVEIELPEGSADPTDADNRYAAAATTWDSWRTTGVLEHDPDSCIYVLEQRYEIAGRTVSRRAFIVEVGLEPFDAGVILPHERTLPKALGDRYELITKTAANFSQVFGLYEDAQCDTNSLFDEVMQTEVIATATDSDGVTSTLWRSASADIAARLASFMTDRQIYIADGHHRYTTALAYRDMRRAEASAGNMPVDDNPAYDGVLMALVNMDDPDLTVLAYHRVVDGAPGFDPGSFRSALAESFDVSDVPAGHPGAALEGRSRPTFMFSTRGADGPFLAELRADIDPAQAIPTEHSSAWKSLDVAVLQELVLWPLLGVHPDRPETLDRLSFTKDAHSALRAVQSHDVACILRPTGLDQLRAVSQSGETMPQKSTYFYPKLLSGLVFRSAE